MTTRRTSALPALALALLAGCGPSLLPGTQIASNRDTRAIADAIEQYRQAMERLDAAAVLQLVAPDYFDNAGTPAPDDDADAATLARRVPADFAQLESLKLGLTLRQIAVSDGTAEAEVFFEGWYRVKTPSGVVPRRDSDLHRMRLRRLDGKWRFVGGL